MNARMIGRSNGGFTTCLVLRVSSHGSLVVANAGHIAPYVAGRELQVESGLPLGLVAGVEYTEAVSGSWRGTAVDGDDGRGVEARSRSGELLGFERAAELSVETAEAIAGAAQSFGQDDDITVLTVARL